MSKDSVQRAAGAGGQGAQRADVALVARGHFESRAQAQAAIAAGLVSVGGKCVARASASIRSG